MDKGAQRLERVKLSQRRLRQKRETELKTLYIEIDTIKAEKDNLQAKVDDVALLILLCKKSEDITNHHLGRMIEIFPAPQENYISMAQFISAYGLNHPNLIHDDVFLLQNVYKTLSECFSKVLTYDGVILIENPYSFKYLSFYGPGMVSQIVTHIDAITNNHCVPSLWLHEEENLPRNVIGIVEALKFLMEHLITEKRSFEILSLALIRYGRITPYGFVYGQKDLDWCVDLCHSPKLDTMILSELSLCFKSCPESLLERLVKL